MKRSLAVLALALAALAGLSGCSVITGGESPSASPAGIDLHSFMSQPEIDQWEKQGIANVANPTAASILAGFDVKIPTFLPPGVELNSKYLVSSNAPLLKQMNSDAPVMVHVQQIWGLPGDVKVVMLLDQSNRPFSHGLVAPATLSCGAGVFKGKESDEPGILSGGFIYHWQQDGIDLDLTGVPVKNLTEVDFDQVVCSIIKQ